MGVSWVLETEKSAQSVELAIERAGGVLQGVPKSFRVDCILFRPPTQVAGQIGNFCLLHHSHYPDSSFIIGAPGGQASSEAGKRGEGTMQQHQSTARATADQGFDLILMKLSSGLVADHATRLELFGSEYHLKDFRIRVGAVSSTSSMASGPKGVVVEVEYGASNVPSQCLGLLAEAVDYFFPGSSEKKPEVLQRCASQPDITYAPIDTVQQYLEIFWTIRRKG